MPLFLEIIEVDDTTCLPSLETVSGSSDTPQCTPYRFPALYLLDALYQPEAFLYRSDLEMLIGNSPSCHTTSRLPKL